MEHLIEREKTGQERITPELAPLIRSVDVVTVSVSPAPKPPRWLLWFFLGGVTTLIGSYLLMEACDLRFCQPFRCEHMHKVRFFQTEVKQVDIVYLGTSQMHYGVMPPVVAKVAAEHGMELGSQYNLAVPGAEFEVSYILARDTLVGDRCPKLLVLGVLPVILAANQDGTAEYVCRYGNLGDVAGRVQERELGPGALVAASFRGMENLLQYPIYSWKRPSRPYRWENLRRSQGGWWLPEDVPATQPAGAADWEAIFAQYGHPKALAYSDDARPARLLHAFLQLANERGFSLIVVYPPQHPELFRRKYASGSEERFDCWIERFTQQIGIRYVNLSRSDSFTADDFGDPVHLNARGAERFSQRLAEVLLSAQPIAE